MEFVDYKCLESLLIEGEEIIATESFVDTVKSVIINFFKLLSKLIDNFINVIKDKFNKSKSKKSNISKEISNEGYSNEMKRACNRTIMKIAESLYNMVSNEAFLLNKNLSKDEFENTDDQYKTMINYIESINKCINETQIMYNEINDNINLYYLDINDTKSKIDILEKLDRTKRKINRYVDTLTKNVNTIVFIPEYKEFAAPVLDTFNKVKSIVYDVIHLVHQLDTL